MKIPPGKLVALGAVGHTPIEAGEHMYRVWYRVNRSGHPNAMSDFSGDLRDPDDRNFGARFDSILVDRRHPIAGWMIAGVPYLYVGSSPRAAIHETIIRDDAFVMPPSVQYIFGTKLKNRNLAALVNPREVGLIDLEAEDVRTNLMLPPTVTSCDTKEYHISRLWAGAARTMLSDLGGLTDGFLWLSRMGFRRTDPPDRAMILYREHDRDDLALKVEWQIELDIGSGFAFLVLYLESKGIKLWFPATR